jgi:LmbE family N-acetylglucosaminyl deacetylase
MRIVVVTAHPDDYTYGVAGTHMAHSDDDRHVVVLAPIQQDAAREVARRLGVELHLLDGEYKKLAASAASLQEQLTSFLADRRPDYVFAPPFTGDWSPDHTSAAQIAFQSFLDSGSLGQWNARFLRYPIPATTTSFQANTWVDLPPSLIELKMELAATMTRGAEDIWPRDVVEWEIQSQHRFAHEVGWPATHVEGFDALYPIPLRRLPPRDDSMEHLQAEHLRKMSLLRSGADLSRSET